MSGQYLGQNFLVDKAVARRIADSADFKSGVAVEIGAGRGQLTEFLVERCDDLTAVEYDPRHAEALLNRFGNVRTVVGDARELTPQELGIKGEYTAIGNLPYYASKVILWHFLMLERRPLEMVFMLQREVAEAVCCGAGRMTQLGVQVQACSAPELLFSVPATAFKPVPKVESAVIKISTNTVEYKEVERLRECGFFDFVRYGFGRPRKYLANSLSYGLNVETDITREMVTELGVGERTRPAVLSVEQWSELFEIWDKLGRPLRPAHFPKGGNDED